MRTAVYRRKTAWFALELTGLVSCPVCEARRGLVGVETEGYLTLVPYRGAVVTTPSPQKALAAMQVRRGLEVMAARLAAANRGGAVAKKLSRVAEQGQRAPDITHLGSWRSYLDGNHR